MQQRYINNYLSINLLRLILFSLLCFSQFINCQDCSGVTPNFNSPDLESDCRFSVVKNKWFTCVTSLDSGNNKTYFAIDTDGNCKFTTYCKHYDNAKTVHPTNECVKSCARINETLKENFIEYGDYCIYSNNFSGNIFGITSTSPTEGPDYDLIDNNGYKILKCNKVQSETIIDKMSYLRCFDGNSCQNVEEEDKKYYDYEEHKCLFNCSDSDKKEIGETKQCVTSCNQGEYFYESVDGTKCLDSCGDNQYYYGEQKPLKCVNSCENDDYILISGDTNNVCIKTCDGGYIYKENNKKYCDKTISGCKGGYITLYSKYCVEKCQDSSSLFGVETFNDNNKCVEDCPLNGNKYKKRSSNEDDNQCVSNCNGQYIYNLECVSDCVNTNNQYHIENENECLYQCPDGYYSKDDEYVCYQRCPYSDENKLYAKDNKCVPCTGEGEYYIEYETDDTNAQNDIRRCYTKCPVDYLFHDYDKHACYKTGTFLNCQEKNEED